MSRILPAETRWIGARFARQGVAMVDAANVERVRPLLLAMGEHAAYLAESLPGAELVHIEGVGQVAPVQRPDAFDRMIAAFLERDRG